MYTHSQDTQQDECLVCLSPILSTPSFVHLVKPLPICRKCLNQFEIMNQSIIFHHHPLHILYYYNEFFRTLLFQYKGLYDYALKDVFLCLTQDHIMRKFRNYIIVIVPSHEEDNAKRGFVPMESIALTFSQQVFTGLYKKEKYKQSDLSYEERQKTKEKIGIRNGDMLYGKKVLIFDDVITSGSTLLACLLLVLQQQPQEVQLLVLSTRRRIEELEWKVR